jgi:predicted ATPase
VIRELTLEHFKCFEHLALPLRALTLLSGVNASGKSTVVQSLALLHQSVVDAEWSGELLLDGASVQLGTVGDVVDKVHGRRSFGLGVAGEGFSARWCFGDPDTQARDAVSAPVHSFTWRGDGADVTHQGASAVSYQGLFPAARDGTATMHTLRELFRSLDHISAERLGPRETYRLGHEAWHDTVGVHGERAPGAIWWYGEERVDASICLASAPPTVRAQTQAWLDHFFPGVVFQIDRVPNASALVLGFRTSSETNFHRPQHVGYGITHVLPLLVAGVRAERNRMIVVENPEVHLHPAGQAAIGHFFARVAARGVSVVIETHSDHVLNGVRRAVHDAVLPADEVAMHFFRERALARRDGTAQVVSPQIDATGNIDHWPRGFFDQFDRDLNYLAGIGE